MNNLGVIQIFVKTQEEYEGILKMARRQGYSWSRKTDHLEQRDIAIPNMLILEEDKTVSFYSFDKIHLASTILAEDERLKASLEEIERYINCPNKYRMNASFTASLMLLTDLLKEYTGIENEE